MAAKKTDIDAITADTFKQAIIELGVSLCSDVKEGRAKQPIETLKEISNLFNAVK